MLRKIGAALVIVLAVIALRHALKSFDTAAHYTVGSSTKVKAVRLNWSQVEKREDVIKEVVPDVKRFFPLGGEAVSDFVAVPVCVSGETYTENIKNKLREVRLMSANTEQLVAYGLETRLRNLPRGYRAITELGQVEGNDQKQIKYSQVVSLDQDAASGRIIAAVSLTTTSWRDACFLAVRP